MPLGQDIGCGIGGPMRQIAKISGANIVGINNNDYQIKVRAVLVVLCAFGAD